MTAIGGHFLLGSHSFFITWIINYEGSIQENVIQKLMLRSAAAGFLPQKQKYSRWLFFVKDLLPLYLSIN